MDLNNTEIEIKNGVVTDGKEKKRSTIVSSTCDFFISVSLFMIFLGLPVFFTGMTLQGLFFEKQLYFYFWVLIALVAWTVKGVLFEEMKIRKTPLDIPILGFLGAYIIATVFSKDHWHSFWGAFGDPSRGLASVIVLIIAYYIIFSNFSQKKIKLALGALLLSNLIVAVWTTLAIFDINFLPKEISAPLSLIGSLSSLFIYFSIMIPLGIVAALKATQSDAKLLFRLPTIVLAIITIILNLFLIFALLNVAGSWVGLIALLVGVAMLLIFILSKIIQLKNFSWAWLPMGVFVAVMIFIMSGQFMDVAKIKLPIEIRQTFQLSWTVSKEAVKNNFFVGSGPATYGYDFSLYRPKESNPGDMYALRFNQGAGILNESIATTGALGTLLLAIVILSYLSVEIYLLSRNKTGDKLYSLGFFVASIIFLINASVLKTEGSILLLGALLSILALAILLSESESFEEYLNFSLKASPKFALALAFIFMVIASGVVFLFVFIGKIFVADIYMKKAVASATYDNSNVLKMNRAFSLYDKESQYFIQASQLQLILANQEAVKAEKDAKIVENYLKNAIQAGAIAKNLGTNGVANVENLAQIYENSGLYIPDSLPLAEENYKRALELEPHNPNYYLKLAQIKFNQSKNAGKDDQAKIAGETKELLQKSIDEKNDFALGYYNMASLQESQNDLDGAIDSMRHAFTIEQTNQGYLFDLGRLYQKRGKDSDDASAEQAFNLVIRYNDKNINAHFALANLYEKNKKNDQAIAEYQKVLDMLPEEQASLRPQISKMIENVRNGVSNLQKPEQIVPEETQPQSTPADIQTDAPQINPQGN